MRVASTKFKLNLTFVFYFVVVLWVFKHLGVKFQVNALFHPLRDCYLFTSFYYHLAYFKVHSHLLIKERENYRMIVPHTLKLFIIF